LEAGDSIEEFLEGFPSVKREQVMTLLQEARERETLESENVFTPRREGAGQS
jgi:uncharacterized protein (DUF433 family)